MKVQASVKPRCAKCKTIKRKGVLRVVCVKTHDISSAKDKL